MSTKTKVLLSIAATWAGVNYEVGVNEMPDDAVKYFVKRGFGESVDGKVSNKAQAEPIEPAAGGDKTSDGLPEDFPMRHVFDALGFKSVEEIQAKSREDLIALDGVGPTSADKALAYGK